MRRPREGEDRHVELVQAARKRGAFALARDEKDGTTRAGAADFAGKRSRAAAKLEDLSDVGSDEADFGEDVVGFADRGRDFVRAVVFLERGNTKPDERVDSVGEREPARGLFFTKRESLLNKRCTFVAWAAIGYDEIGGNGVEGALDFSVVEDDRPVFENDRGVETARLSVKKIFDPLDDRKQGRAIERA
jgi:hypothetical protein